MAPISHGSVLLLADVEPAITTFHAGSVPTVERCYPALSKFGYLFDNLQCDPKQNLLLEHPQTAQNLIDLGYTMIESSAAPPAPNSEIPSAYTYFAQFVDHDITLEAVSKDIPLDNHLTPMELIDVQRTIKNARTAALDLDTVYEPAFREGAFHPIPRDSTNPNKLQIDRASTSPTSIHNPPGTDSNDSDLPRVITPNDPEYGVAQIGDSRNDQNLMISQMHLAFLRAHNALIDQGKSFDEAAKLLRQHYQWIVIHDFLPRIVDRSLVTDVLSGAIGIYDPPDRAFFLPLEFTVAAYRFGHSMIRSAYHYNALNENNLEANLFALFRPQVLPPRYHHISESWIIQWDRFVDGGTNKARSIDTQLANSLSGLADNEGRPLNFQTRLAIRDLLRGYLLRIPTGQAVARALKLPMMHCAELEAVAQSANPDQKALLKESGMSCRTPLWFYVLAEASHYNSGKKLGPVGGAIVASVLIGLVRRSKDSILRYKNWSPTLGRVNGQFDLSDLFSLAKVLPCS